MLILLCGNLKKWNWLLENKKWYIKMIRREEGHQSHYPADMDVNVMVRRDMVHINMYTLARHVAERMWVMK